MPKKRISAPSTLGDAGKAMWDDHASKYVLRPDELARLEMACRARDMVARLDAVWVEKGCPTETRGSMGQEVIHPLIGELRAQQAQVDAILSRLKLPDLVAGVETNQNRSAAQSSWAPGAARGRGA